MVKTAVVLAGGKGTRLQSAFPDLAKPMVPIAGKPVLQHLVETYSAQGIERFFFTIGHLGEQIRAHFGDGSDFGVTIAYIEEDRPLGTAGAVGLLKETLEGPFWIMYGDTLSDIDLSQMEAFHVSKRAQATLLVHPNDHPYDSDLIQSDRESRVVSVFGKPHPTDVDYPNCVNAAFYLFEAEMLQFIPEEPSDFGRDLFPSWAKTHRLFAYSTPEYIKDMGKPERHAEVEQAWMSGKIAARNLRFPQKAIFLDRDGVINLDTDLIKHPDEMQVYPFAGPAVRRINQSPFISVVVTNQSAVARGLTDLDGIDAIHARMDRQLGDSRAFVDALYYCPHHPHGGFPEERPEYKIPCSCRKPSPGMLFAAAERFHIDLDQSWMIGDSSRDIEAGNAAGVRTIRVRTGHGALPGPDPDFWAENLEEAVSIIFTETSLKP
ncbi:MAG TPA: D,D-heptose 1,7-bisphosphate phosphatase [Cryomorphaceae bacterium]|nr:D,D-heptose 1,7-bisphosphate phosphatase [Cryomorphaceae bacterium]